MCRPAPTRRQAPVYAHARDPGWGRALCPDPSGTLWRRGVCAEEGAKVRVEGSSETSLVLCARLRTLIVPVPGRLAAHERGLTEDGV